jgi:hypothetical protein
MLSRISQDMETHYSVIWTRWRPHSHYWQLI